MMRLIQRGFLWAAVALAAGCASTVPTFQPLQAPRPAQPVAPTVPVNDNRVIIDSALGGTLRLLNVMSSTGRDGLLKMQVNVQNTTDSPRWFSYRLEWFDQNGELLPLASDGSMPWMLLAHETSSIVATAPAVTAKDFGVAFLAAPD